jgi:hypothetical protein
MPLAGNTQRGTIQIKNLHHPYQMLCMWIVGRLPKHESEQANVLRPMKLMLLKCRESAPVLEGHKVFIFDQRLFFIGEMIHDDMSIVQHPHTLSENAWKYVISQILFVFAALHVRKMTNAFSFKLEDLKV